MPELTERELQVIQRVVDGMTNAAIAKDLHLSVEGVKSRLSKAFDKTGMSTRTELIGYALRHGYAKL